MLSRAGSYNQCCMQARTTSPTEFRKALAQFATGVTVVTTRAAGGAPIGVTANSFNAVSLDPPLVLWSLSNEARSLAAFRASERYLVHVLAAGQLELARRFATRGGDKFAAPWPDSDGGLPRLPGCVAWFECENRRQYDEGDHVILIGRVESLAIAGGAPLIFHDGRYLIEQVEAPLPRVLRRASGA